MSLRRSLMMRRRPNKSPSCHHQRCCSSLCCCCSGLPRRQLLNGRMQVQWDAMVDGVVIRLSAKMDESEYAAFGLSGAEGRTLMIGGDVTVAWLDATTGKFHADDYILSAKSQVNRSFFSPQRPATGSFSFFLHTFSIPFSSVPMFFAQFPVYFNRLFDSQQ